ncbi:exopolysaccharide biosynthesis protein [Gilvimarinus sp. F26214L]|uniref:exopolysaccharide biosynthesis protein n=1 Tax=Gilvimarinus sp. DZF01 TaxID=3461371 RepID=UPI0040462FC2
MSQGGEVTNLEELLDRIGEASAEHGEVSWDAVMDEVGTRSFGPILLLAGLVTLAPVVGDIPGVPTLVGVFVFLVAIQLLFGQQHFWLPQFLLKRSIAEEKLTKARGWMRRPARFIDRLLRPRLQALTSGVMHYVIALMCLCIAMAMPVMEVVPFSANLAGAALTAFGLAMIARDGILAVIAFAFTGGIAWLIIAQLV